MIESKGSENENSNRPVGTAVASDHGDRADVDRFVVALPCLSTTLRFFIDLQLSSIIHDGPATDDDAFAEVPAMQFPAALGNLSRQHFLLSQPLRPKRNQRTVRRAGHG